MSLTAKTQAEELSERRACDLLSINRSTLRAYRTQAEFVGPPAPVGRSRLQSAQPNALSEEERQAILVILNSDEFCNQPPAQVYYTLLSRGQYFCSISTMHRLLRCEHLNGERRNQRPAQKNAIPRLHAQSTNEVWTWDITKLATIQRGVYLSLYVVIDLFSRFIVAWMLSKKENSALATQLIQEASARYSIEPSQLTLHQDRGTPMTAHCYLDLLGELAITASHSRPRVSNDNPMSESQFKTLKYQPDYPRRFDGYGHAHQWCEDYVQWYNREHHHSALAGFTPAQVFTGKYTFIVAKRQTALNEAFRLNPQRFINGTPKVAMPPDNVYINPIVDLTEEPQTTAVNFPTLTRAKAI